MKKIILKNIILIVTLLSFNGCRDNNKSGMNDRTLIRPTVKQMSRTVHFVGRVYPVESHQIKAEINSKINKLYVKLGDTVKKGDLILTYDKSFIETEISKRKNDVKRIGLEVKNQQLLIAGLLKKTQRVRKLYKRNIASAQESEDLISELRQSRNNLSILEGDLRQSQKEFEKFQALQGSFEVRAPISGLVAVSWIGANNFVPGTAVQNGDVLMEIARNDSFLVNGQIPESDLYMLKSGAPVKIFSPATPDRYYDGRVTRIYSVPIIDQRNNIAQFPVDIEIFPGQAGLRIGMLADCNVLVAQKENALVIPRYSLKYDFNSPYVEVYDGVGFQKKPVTIGLLNELEVEILSGISPQDVILVK
ncbi:MAG: efflux RND transporter periplasmic adaptor subunit [Bdellovibrionales bacterium]|nr:efflux RND transporter periplasmic adaptor subunit [Bdellovibrionales bacterium]